MNDPEVEHLMTPADSNRTFYTFEAPVWDGRKCRTESLKLYSVLPMIKFVFSGGCVHDGKWYDGELHPLPILPPGWKWYNNFSWGWRVRKVKDVT